MSTRVLTSSLILVAGAVALAMPVMKGTEHFEATVSDNAPAEVTPSRPNPWSKQQGQTQINVNQQEVSSWNREVTLHRAPDGHFYADVVVNGQSLHMLVDTGATVIALTGDDARRLGVSWNSFELATIGQGASGPVEGINTRLGRVTLGSFEASDVGAVVIPEGLHVSLLGQSFLSSLGSVQISDDRMVIGS